MREKEAPKESILSASCQHIVEVIVLKNLFSNSKSPDLILQSHNLQSSSPEINENYILKTRYNKFLT